MDGETLRALGGDVVVLTMVGALVIPVVLIVLAGELGRRTSAAGLGDQPSSQGHA